MAEDNILIDIIAEMIVDSDATLVFASNVYKKLFIAETNFIVDLYKSKDMVISLENARKEAEAYILRILKLLVSMDETFKNIEVNFYEKASGKSVDYEQMFQLTNGGSDPRYIQHVYKEVSLNTEEVRLYTFMLATAFCAYTGNLEEPASKVLNTLLGLALKED